MIAIACDHGGFDLKTTIMDHLKAEGVAYKDLGTFDGKSVDYPEIALLCAEEVAQGNYERGIIICGTGIGVCIAANKVKGIRAALCHDVFSAKMARLHNDSNILTLGGRVIGPSLAVEIVMEWIKGDFEGGRHKTRIEQIAAYEAKNQ